MVQKTYKHEPVEEFVFDDWLRDSIKGVRETVEGRVTGKRRVFDTSEFHQHVHNARKEYLLAMRSLLDSAIEWLDPQEENPKQEA